ncbi:MAG: pseudaminic acid cytidylyltransferase, partial [Roseibium sp.]
MSERVVAVIPARGGSKGIPGKNIKPFLGLPLVAHSIRAALAAGTVSEVVVSSD